VETKAQAASGDKVKHRLEQLDDMDEGSVKETLNLNQKDYVRKIDELNRSLVTAWDNDQRVKALKIAIQVLCVEGGGVRVCTRRWCEGVCLGGGVRVCTRRGCEGVYPEVV
jgi:hypothetical protein